MEEYEALYNKGLEMLKLKKYDDAILYFNKALELNKRYKEAYEKKGDALLTLGRTDEALNCFTVATNLDPDYVEAWEKKEAAHLLRGDYDDAIKCLDNITRIKPDDERAWLDKGSLMLNLHRFRSAVECFDKAIGINPNSEGVVKKEEALKHIGGVTKREVTRLIKKICILGDGAVGKTSLIRRYVHDVFDDKYLSTIGAKITKKVITLKYHGAKPDVVLTFMIWDIAGQKDYNNVHPTYYQGAEGALVVCDITRKETLESMSQWVESLYAVANKVPIVFLANKSDLKMQAAFNENDMKNTAARFKIPSFFTSAKTGQNVEEAFSTIGRELLKGEE
ncbi:MAG: GTP-binding protein [Thermoplasmatales archaeon]|nr:GTP-binding protein [Thermoplasmatales archaeon]